ncbi:MAG TPA: MnmC family methyltransferase, partial [Roseimicrobium sp.]|nr:MnmC family methyltransferase [Roseimicrobium sp.]
MSVSGEYQLVQLKNGVFSVHSVAERETFHPVIGPAAEAEALYVRQQNLAQRLDQEPGEFVLWDVGLGAAANVLTVLRLTRGHGKHLRIISFDHTLAPLAFALKHSKELGYVEGFEAPIATLLKEHRVEFVDEGRSISWQVHLGDFPAWLGEAVSALPQRAVPAPHAILFDAFSPAKNPTMWTLPLFTQLFRMLDPQRPCVLPTYSRSTLLRVTLLLAGFYVGA